MPSGSFTGDAALEAEQTGSFTADAVVQRTESDSFTADAAIEVEQTSSYTADAFILSIIGRAFMAEAYIVTGETSGFWYHSTVGDAGQSPYGAEEYAQDTLRTIDMVGPQSHGYVSTLEGGVIPARHDRYRITGLGEGRPSGALSVSYWEDDRYSPSRKYVQIRRGAALVYGRRFRNTTNVNIRLTENVEDNPRLDRVVICANFTDETYTGVSRSVYAHTIRLAVLEGTVPIGATDVNFWQPEWPPEPEVPQGATSIYMVPLAQVYIPGTVEKWGENAITDENRVLDERQFAGVGGMRLIGHRIIPKDLTTWKVQWKIPTNRFRRLRLIGNVVHDDTGSHSAGNEVLNLRFNGYDSRTYAYINLRATGAGVLSTQSYKDTAVRSAFATYDPGGTYADSFVIDVFNAHDMLATTSVLSRGMVYDDGALANLQLMNTRGWWNMWLSPILKVEAQLLGSETSHTKYFCEGSIISLYGIA